MARDQVKEQGRAGERQATAASSGDAAAAVRGDRRRVVVVVAAVVGYFAYRAAARSARRRSSRIRATCTSRPRPTPHVPYNSDPPTSGRTCRTSRPWGVHTEPISKELQVHNLEDGGVMVQYNCPPGAPTWSRSSPASCGRYDRRTWSWRRIPAMKTRIALTAWTRLDALRRLRRGPHRPVHRGVPWDRSPQAVEWRHEWPPLAAGAAVPPASAVAPAAARVPSCRRSPRRRTATRSPAAYDATWRALVRALAKRERAAPRGGQGLRRDRLRRLRVADRASTPTAAGSATSGSRARRWSPSRVFVAGRTATARRDVQVNAKMRTQAYRRG